MPTDRQEPTATPEWSEIHRRLEAHRVALTEIRSPSAEEKKKILRARAKDLAKEAAEDKEGEGSVEIVEFLLAHEKYGIESSYVGEIHPLKELTPVPGTPSFVLGIINMRGQILSVIDLKKFFDLPEKGLTDLNRVIVIRDDKMEFGVLADLIVGVRSIPADQIQPSLPTLTGIRDEHLKGVTRERVVILDAEKILSNKKIIVHEEVQG